MKKTYTLRDFLKHLKHRGLTERYAFYFYNDATTNFDVEYLEEPGDLHQLMIMDRPEFIAYMGLLETMNFLEGESSLKAGTDGDWIGRPHYWYGVNQYWIKNYPAAYRYLEVAVWG
jgi:ABC-type proline/glycine betaine transport system substrate-binding protein